MTKRTVRSYQLEFKKSSAKLAVESDQPIAQTAKSHHLIMKIIGISYLTHY